MKELDLKELALLGLKLRIQAMLEQQKDLENEIRVLKIKSAEGRVPSLSKNGKRLGRPPKGE